MADYSKPPNPYGAPNPYAAAETQPLVYQQPPASYPQQVPYGYQQQPYQQPYQTAVVIQDAHHHVVHEEDNFCLGCIMGWLFGLFGLICLLCVRHRPSYIKGWIVPFIIGLIVGVIIIILYATGVIVITHNYNY